MILLVCDIMKKNVKIFILALLMGIIGTIIFTSTFDSTLITNAIEKKAYLLIGGTYTTKEQAEDKLSEYSRGIIYNNNGLYEVVIGIYPDRETKDIMASYFRDNAFTFSEKELKANGTLINNLENFVALIKKSDDEYYESINNSLLQIFKEYIN